MAKVRCPNCGVYHEIDEPKKGTFENRVRRPFRTDAMAPTLPQPGIVRETPINLPTLPSHVYVPLLQSLIDGFYIFPVGVVGGIVVVAVVDGATKLEITGWGFALAGIAGGVMASFLWAGQKWNIHLRFVNSLLWVAEEIFQTDFDGDEEIGQPTVNRVEVELRRNGKPWKFESLEISQDRLIKLARAVANGQSFANRTALECGIPREEFEKLRNKFVSRGWAEWKGEPGSTLGVRLTDEGLDIIAEMATTPLPRANHGVSENVRRSHSPNPAQGNNYERFDHIRGAR